MRKLVTGEHYLAGSVWRYCSASGGSVPFWSFDATTEEKVLVSWLIRIILRLWGPNRNRSPLKAQRKDRSSWCVIHVLFISQIQFQKEYQSRTFFMSLCGSHGRSACDCQLINKWTICVLVLHHRVSLSYGPGQWIPFTGMIFWGAFLLTEGSPH